MMFEGYLSSSSDEEIYAAALVNKTKNANYINDTVNQYTNSEFFEHFRVSKEVAASLARKFEDSQYFNDQNNQHGKLSAYAFTVIFLWFAGHEAASYRDVSDRFGISISSLKKIIDRMTYFLSNLSQEVITWPDIAEQSTIKQHFSLNGFADVIGVIDGSHVKIDKPSEDPDSYLNRKGFYSMQFQVVCDHTRKIRDVVIGFPGSVHDSRVFRVSPLHSTLHQKCGDNYILGDSGYPCSRNLLTPFKDLGNLTRRQQNYNRRLASTRYVVEHCFGILKQKFRQLYHLKLRGDHLISNFIRACCVLHNIALNDSFSMNDHQEVDDNTGRISIDHSYSQQPNEEPGDESVGVQIRQQIANNLPES